MKVLIGCEESQAVCVEFRKLGHEAYSCDILPCSGGHPEWHIQGDVFEIINSRDWDMGVFFPPCTDLCVSGARWFKEKKEDGRQQKAIDFFLKLIKLKIPWAIENPIGIMSTHYRKPDQIIQPWQFGHKAQKSTCIWLHNLPLLVPTEITSTGEFYTCPDGKTKLPSWSHDMVFEGKKIGWNTELIKKLRSKTFTGIAKAMASQWGNESYSNNQ